ncbi:cysteine-rich DPF motif domain-containing protein 1 [Musca vetustissima]|uniref:cysteine-rich DPF motif domain-containing protein 1 n=1 Tax=Musca vetustissima TaxID=27455 RepID=UPI002AB6EF0C|nr:cysteine-rich DPF motif domain-containing protein 1 [Musca vetustissima]
MSDELSTTKSATDPIETTTQTSDDTPKEPTTTETKETDTVIDDRILFHCKLCGLHEKVHYYGEQPSFVYGLEFCEPTYIMRDPFQPPIPKWKSKPEYFIAIGAECIRCSNMICKDTSCSFFYKRTYCMECAKALATTFPMDIQVKIKKQLAMGTMRS